jgi:hypothetical protein
MVNEIKVKSILNKHKRRDDWFLDDYSINPYEGVLLTVSTAT